MSAVAALALLGVPLTSCSGGGGGTGTAPGAATTAAAQDARPRGCLPAGDPAASTTGGYGVGQATVTFIDHSRPTDAVADRHLVRRPDRTLPVVVSYPFTRPAGAAPTAPPVAGAKPAPGQFPVVVLSHGVTSDGTVTAALAAPFVREGFAVATPTYPLSSGPAGTILDLPNQPADVSFVITSLGTWGNQPGSPLAGHLAANCVAVAGHSLGAATTLAAAYLSCCRDSRIKAVVSMSGVLAPFRGTFAGSPPIPLLLLHGDQDKTVPLQASKDAFASLRGPRYFVTLHGADHVTIFIGDAGRALDLSTVSFLNAYLKGDFTGVHALPGDVRLSSVASIQTAT
jgi:predicted dienelactone hydrolase